MSKVRTSFTERRVNFTYISILGYSLKCIGQIILHTITNYSVIMIIIRKWLNVASMKKVFFFYIWKMIVIKNNLNLILTSMDLIYLSLLFENVKWIV